MTAILILALGLFFTDRKITKIISACLLPAFIFLPAFFRVKSIEGYAFYTGLILLGLSPFIEILAEKACMKIRGLIRAGEKEKPKVREEDGEDILDNKKKWGLIKAAFAILIIMALILLVSVLRLNTKVNNMYVFSTEQQNRIEEQQKLIDKQQEEIKELKKNMEM